MITEKKIRHARGQKDGNGYGFEKGTTGFYTFLEDGIYRFSQSRWVSATSGAGFTIRLNGEDIFNISTQSGLDANAGIGSFIFEAKKNDVLSAVNFGSGTISSFDNAAFIIGKL
jgi:hypothetical protein